MDIHDDDDNYVSDDVGLDIDMSFLTHCFNLTSRLHF